MNIVHALALAIAMGTPVPSSKPNTTTVQESRVVRLMFSKTDVADVLHAISLRTGANIVFAVKAEIPITINITAQSTEEAIKSTSAAAGLTYRRVGNTFVVSTPEGMRQALIPFGNRVKFSLVNVRPADAAKSVMESFQHVTAEAAGDKLAVTAVPADIVLVRDFIAEMEKKKADQRVRLEIVTVRFSPTGQIATILKNFYPSLTVDPVNRLDQPGQIAITGPAADLEAALKTLESLDVTPQGTASTEVYKIYEIRYSSAPILKDFLKEAAPEVNVTIGPESYSPRAAGFRPLSGARIGGSSGATGVDTGTSGGTTTSGTGESSPVKEGERAKVLILRGPERSVEATLRLLAEVDTKPKQVVVEVRVVDTSPERTEELGIQWDWTRFGFYELLPGTLVNNTSLNTTRPAGFGQFSRVPWTIDAILSGMVTRKEAKILANPSVQVLDGDEANVFIGETIRARLAQAGGLGAQTVEVAEFPVGIILLLRPRVNADGNITMRVHPVVSTVTAIDSDNIPQTSSREAETTVMVKNGETMVIGGLIRDEMSKTVSEVPFLSKLPLIGELFRNRSTSRRHSEILVFITPRIIEDTPTAADKSKGGSPEKEKKQ